METNQYYKLFKENFLEFSDEQIKQLSNIAVQHTERENIIQIHKSRKLKSTLGVSIKILVQLLIKNPELKLISDSQINNKLMQINFDSLLDSSPDMTQDMAEELVSNSIINEIQKSINNINYKNKTLYTCNLITSIEHAENSFNYTVNLNYKIDKTL
jgi:hypothetical protein